MNYKGKYISGADFTAETNLKLGDYVVACGTLTYYSGGSQAEFAQGSNVISVLRAPSFSPADGNFSTATLSVTITADSGTQIRYTTDGTNPTATTGTVYSSAISINATTTIKAIAVKANKLTIFSIPTICCYRFYFAIIVFLTYIITGNGKE